MILSYWFLVIEKESGTLCRESGEKLDHLIVNGMNAAFEGTDQSALLAGDESPEVQIVGWHFGYLG